MQYLLGSLLFCIMLTSCKGGDSDVVADTEDTAGVSYPPPPLFEIAERLESTSPSLNANKFSEAGSKREEAFEFFLIEDQVKPFLPYLIYNTDSSFAADPFSYNYLFNTRSGSKRVDEAGPDFEIGLIDVKQQKRSRIWFTGPAAYVTDVFWKNKNEIVVIGFEQISPDNGKPFAHVINIASGETRMYEYSDTLKMLQLDFLKETLAKKANVNY
ncbi:MAG: hypothetical protein M3413_09630 [Bacteroidota bacterium]|nr:hypothetical protein [Flavisolibacter sp.]MDQ3551777.1 hypothetical protein [Bacteroidota bacterium]